MKHLITYTALGICLLLTACGGSSKPSKKEMQEAIFGKKAAYATFHEFTTNFVDNPEMAKQNIYDSYINMKVSFNEPLYIKIYLDNPYAYDIQKYPPVVKLAKINEKRMHLNNVSLSPILWKLHEKNKVFETKMLVRFSKTENSWVKKSITEFMGDEIIGSVKAHYKDTLIFGSPEHLKELSKYGIELKDLQLSK